MQFIKLVRDYNMDEDKRVLAKRISLFLIGSLTAFQAGLTAIPESESLVLSAIPLHVWLSGLIGGLVGATSTEVSK